ncbi:hypothetical protein MP228_003764 [Amoeboaphelidium protococcarum]|nr:hypothetical protein MP228_003764 [Amoeboaphelidium protococcarum]
MSRNSSIPNLSDSADLSPTRQQLNEDDKRRSRSRLKDFYGLQAGASVSDQTTSPTTISEDQVSVSSSSNTFGTGNLNSNVNQNASNPVLLESIMDQKDFNVEQYTTFLLKSQNLQTLLATQTNLIQECKNLDGDMKTLVYENYEKFITAGKTIGKMRGIVQDAESEVGRLLANIDEISSKSKALSHALDNSDYLSLQLKLDSLQRYQRLNSEL